jgi:hypothetical protein
MRLPGFLTSKIQSPDILRVMWLWSIIGLAAFSQVLYHTFWPSHDGYDVTGYKLGRDFANVWLGARLTLEGKLSHLYDFPSYMKEMRALFGPDYTQHNFSYPPTLLPLIALFGLLPYFPAFAAWIASGIAALTTTIRANGRVAASWHLPALLLFSPAFMINLVVGQNGCFTAACFLGGFYLCDASPVIAGILFGLLTIKPHLGILIPFVLLLRKKWKCIASAWLTTAALISLSLVLWGVTPWMDYWTKGIAFQKGLLELSAGYYRLMMPGVYADARVVMRFGIMASVAVQLLCSAWVFVLVLWNVWRDGFTARTVAMLAIGTSILMPYSFNYDLVIASGAVIVFLATLEEMLVLEHLAFGLLWALPLAIYELKNVPMFPLSSGILLLLMAVLHVQGKASRDKLVPGSGTT